MSVQKALTDSAATRRAAAKAWLDQCSWHVAVMRGTRVLPEIPGEEDAPPVVRTTMRVYTEGCPLRLMKDILYLLGVEAEQTDPIIDGVPVPGKWKHKYAFWNRDGGMSGNGDSTKTLIRDFTDGDSETFAAVEDGCGSRTSVRYVFDAVDVESLSSIDHSGEQGYAVRIGGVSRDRESDLFSYYVTITERKTQYLEKHEVTEDVFSKDYASDWMGLRGTVDDPTDDAGDGVTVWDPAVQAAGTVASVQWNRNLEDCTLNAHGRKRVAKQGVTAVVSCSKDAFGEQDSTAIQAATKALGHAPEAANGVSYDYRSETRPDKLFNTTELKKSETAVADAQVSEELTRFSRRRRTVSKSVDADMPKASAARGVGVSGSESLTAGRRKDVTRQDEEELFVGAAQVSEVDTVFENVYKYTDVHSRADRPAASYADGVAVETSEDIQPLGSKNISVSIRTEKDVPEAARETSKTAFEETVSVTEVSAGAAEDAPEPNNGLIIARGDTLTQLGKHRKTERQTQEIHVPNAAVSITKTPLFIRTVRSAKNSPIGESLAEGEYGAIQSTLTPGKRCDTSKATTEDILGAESFVSYEDNYLQRTEVRKSIVERESGKASKLVGRVLTSDAFSRTDGGNWERTRTIETVPAKRQWTLFERVTTGVYLEQWFVDSHVKTVMFLNASPEEAAAMLAEFQSLYKPFTIVHGLMAQTTYYFAYTIGLSFGLRPDKFGTWSGTVTVSAELVNKMQGQVVTTEE